MRIQKGPIRVHRGPYLTLREPYEDQMGPYETIKCQMESLGASRWSIQDQRGSQRPHYEPKGFHRAPISGPRESYGDEQLAFFLIFCEILFCLVFAFSFVTFSILTQIHRSWSFSNRERNGHKENMWYF